jgi:predicted lipopolysaccharide heptosyltransferase III
VKILLLQLKRIGDLILTTPAIAAVRERFSDAQIILAVSPGSSGLLPAIGGIDDALVVGRGWREDAAAWGQIARHRYDICVDFTHNDRSAFLTLLSRAPRRITADYVEVQSPLRALCYTDLPDVSVFEMHNVDYNLALLAPLGITDTPQNLQLQIPPTAADSLDRVLRDSGVRGDFVLLHPGSARIEKFWEPERWRDVAKFAASRGLASVLTGGSSPLEQAHIAAIKAAGATEIVDLSGRIDLLTLVTLIARARLLVTVDSAPAHIAAAARTPQVALYGPTNPHHWRPRFTPAVVLQAGDARPLTQFTPFQQPAAMNLISTEQVIDAMEALLALPRSASI